MTDPLPKPCTKGSKSSVLHCKGALESLTKALESFPKRRHGAMRRGIQMQIERLSDGHPMSKENFPQERNLPKFNGQSAKKFNALKRIPVRGYCCTSLATMYTRTTTN